MIYITSKRTHLRQLTWEDILFADTTNFAEDDGSKTITHVVENIPEKYINMINVSGMINRLKEFNVKYHDLINTNKEVLYKTFYIPKASGGMRRIDAPNDELKFALTEFKNILENEFKVLYHTAAFAYVKGRSIVDAAKKHQLNESNWYMKTDFSGFFPHTTKEFVMKMFSMIYPLNLIVENKEGKNEISKALDLCFLNGGLPQGTPVSPTLTNIICIPIDHALFNHFAHKRIVYTRYADDMQFSCVQSFKLEEIIDTVNDVLKKFDAPWTLKKEKTHYGSRAGRNWILGLMVNKDNEITIGHARKKEYKAMLCNFAVKPEAWDLDDVKRLQGLTSYYKSIEPEYIKYLIEQASKKFNCDIEYRMKHFI